MRVRRSVTAAGAAVILGTTGALAPAAASAHGAAHTLRFTSVARKFVRFSKTTGAEQDTDVSAAGKIIGFDDANFAVGKTTSSADIAFVLRGGFLYGSLKVSRSTATGPVTGGTGRFAAATGTITGTSAGKDKEAITITYRS